MYCLFSTAQDFFKNVTCRASLYYYNSSNNKKLSKNLCKDFLGVSFLLRDRRYSKYSFGGVVSYKSVERNFTSISSFSGSSPDVRLQPDSVVEK